MEAGSGSVGVSDGEPDRRDTLKRRRIDVGALNPIDLEPELDDRVGVAIVRFAN